jgi:hypothetical protein
MHAEHAELISALRAENDHLNKQLARAMEWKTVAEAQDKLLVASDRAMLEAKATIVAQRDMIERLGVRLKMQEIP